MCQAMGRFGIWGKQTHDESVIPRDIARDTFIKSWCWARWAKISREF